MTEQVCMDGPFTVDVKVGITDGKNTGIVTVGMAAGTFPSPDNIKAAIKSAEKAAGDQGYRLMDRHEFIKEEMGIVDIAVPGPKEFR